MKKNGMEKWKKFLIIGAAVGLVGTLLSYTTKVSVYIEAPEHIKANAQNIYDIQAYINEQRIANKLMQEIQQQRYYEPQQPRRKQIPDYTEPYCEVEDNGEVWCWDEYYQKWWKSL